jgi:hypothetical protein
MATLTTRETIATTINESTVLRDLGLPENAVFQADTMESPTMRPFVVIRWLQEQAGIGPVSRRPFDLWWYGKEGDYDTIEKLGVTAQGILGIMEQVETVSGRIMRIHTTPIPSVPNIGRGDDLWDDGYKAPVIPFRCQAVASGL